MTVILNPVAGQRGRRPDPQALVAVVQNTLAREGVPGEARLTEGAGHAFALARAALDEGAALVCAWGGDGTVNEVARALCGTGVPLGIVPAGSGNGLARELGLPRRPVEALRLALRGEDRTIDAGELDGRLFFATAGIGLDAQVAARFNARPGGRRGVLAYGALAARELLAYPGVACAIQADDEQEDARVLLAVLANGRQYGGGARIAPDARPDDGQLDLVVVEARPALAVLWQARRLFSGTLAGAPGIRWRRVRKATLTAEAPLLFHVDGEAVQGGTRLTARVHAGLLRVRAPRRRHRAVGEPLE